VIHQGDSENWNDVYDTCIVDDENDDSDDESKQTVFLGCIECMRCRLLSLMFALSVCQSLCHLAQLTQLYCAGAFSAAFAK